jgi:hypothetical protein
MLAFIAYIFMIVFFIALGLLALGIVILVAWMFAIHWVFGVPISIKKNDKVIGYLRWFKYTKAE